jgi:hypothetical protein
MNRFQTIFDAQKALFATGVTRTYEWRVDQLDRMARMIKENEGPFGRRQSTYVSPSSLMVSRKTLRYAKPRKLSTTSSTP